MTSIASGPVRRPFSEFVPRIRDLYEAHRDPVAAGPMSAYMRGQFLFLGIKAPNAAALLREALAGVVRPGQSELAAAARSLWQLPEREYQYAGTALLARHAEACSASFLPVIEELILAKSWWDTVDTLAVNVVGPLVFRHPELGSAMDVWIASEHTWLARSAILHQLKYKGSTDSEKLFRYCLTRSADREFFIRKAIGWALREYSKTDAATVRNFVAGHDTELSGLSKREALLWLSGGRRVRPRPAASVQAEETTQPGSLPPWEGCA